MALSPVAVQKLVKEYRDLQQSPVDGVIAFLREDDITDIQAEYEGPGYFLTKIFHPNVSASGEICVNTLKRDWSPEHGLRHILTVIRCLLVEPNPESALNEEAGRLLLEGFAEFAKKAALYTSIHAKRSTPLTTSGVANTASTTAQAAESAPKTSPRPAAAPKRAPAPEKKKSLKRL